MLAPSGEKRRFKDGWVCRACWKPNRPGDDRCYRCKSPREDQAVVEPGSRQHMAEAGRESADRLDAKVRFLGDFVAWPLRVAGAGGVVIGILLFLSALANSDRPDMFGMDRQVAAGLMAAAFLLAGIGLFFVARSVMRRARWAYALGGAVAILGALPRLLGFVRLPEGVESAPSAASMLPSDGCTSRQGSRQLRSWSSRSCRRARTTREPPPDRRWDCGY